MAPDQPSDEASKLPDTEGDRNINEWESKSTTTQNAEATQSVSSDSVTEARPATSLTQAPTQLRENMISTAVKFLQNPQVQSSPLSQRKAFLKKKGLTDEEIRTAIERSGVKEPVAVPSMQQGQQLAPHRGTALPAGPPPPPPPRSIYSKSRDFAAVAIIISGVTYGLYKLFQKIIRPFFKRQGESDKRLQNIEASLLQVNNTLTATVQEIQRSVSLIQTSLEKQEDQLEQISRDVIASKALASGRGGGTGDMNQIKQEIISLKGLMLNRHQFPSTPQQSSIPDWQKVSSTPSQETNQEKPLENGKGEDFDQEESIKKDLIEDLKEEHPGDTNGPLTLNGGLNSPTQGTEVKLMKKSMLENSFNQAEQNNLSTPEKAGGQAKSDEEVD